MTTRSEPHTRRRALRVTPAGEAGPGGGPDILALRVLGAQSGMPLPSEPSSGYLLRAGSVSMLFDCGPGTAGELRAALGADRLDAAFISHLHLDHCHDLLPIGKAMLAPHVSYPRDGRPGELVGEHEPVPCAVPAGASAPLQMLQGLFPVHTTPVLDQAFELGFTLREYAQGDRIRIGDCEVTAVGLRHVVSSCGFRVQTPLGSFAYTADTGWTEALLELAEEVDLLLCEASLGAPDPGPHGHLCAAEAGRLAASARVGALALTHYSGPFADRREELLAAAAPHFTGPTVVAASRTVIDFSPKGAAQ